MKLSVATLKTVSNACEVMPGNIYPARGGKAETTFWLVVAVSNTGAHLIGFNAAGSPVSTGSYLKSVMRERPLLGRVRNLDQLVLETQ